MTGFLPPPGGPIAAQKMTSTTARQELSDLQGASTEILGACRLIGKHSNQGLCQQKMQEHAGLCVITRGRAHKT